MVVILEPIIPERLVRAKIDSEVYSAVTVTIAAELDKMEEMFGLGTRTWSSQNQPAWKKRIGRGLAISGLITTGSTPFAYVEVGTRYRLRAMTRDFRPKTRPGVLGSGPGAGGAAGWFRRPRPGIKARNFRDIIARKRYKPFADNIEDALIKVIIRSL